MEALKLTIGEIRTELSFLRVMLAIDTDGFGRVYVYASENGKDRSAYLRLDGTRWAALKELIAQADATIERLKKSGQLKFVAEGFQLAGE